MFYNFILKYFLLHEWNFIILKDAYIFIDIIMYVWCEYLYFLLFQQIYLMLISKLNKRLIFSLCLFTFFLWPFYRSNVPYWILKFRTYKENIVLAPPINITDMRPSKIIYPLNYLPLKTMTYLFTYSVDWMFTRKLLKIRKR